MQDQVGLAHFFQRRAKAFDQFVRKVRNKAHSVGDNRRTPLWQFDRALGGVQRRKQQVFGKDFRARQTVEQRRFTGVGIAHKSHRRERHTFTGLAMQPAGAAHLFQFGLQPHNLVGDQASVDFDLGFTRTTCRARATALALKVGPRADQAGAFIFQTRQFDLKPPFAGARSAAKNFEDQAGAVDDLHLPRPFEVALLDRCQLVINDHSLGLGSPKQCSQFFDLA